MQSTNEEHKDAMILVINCGSSSLKYEVYSMPQMISHGKGRVERIGMDIGNVEQKSEKGEITIEVPVPDHKTAFKYVVEAITDPEKGIVKSKSEINAIGHRVVHGGENYSESVVIDKSVEKAIQENAELAPLHNPANLTGIQEAKSQFEGIDNVAVFDTAFHQTMPPAAYLYGIPRELYRKYKIRRYGFHGTSHRYVANRALDLLYRSNVNTNLITCHLGNGASITAIERGLSIDTSMGFTPLEGVMMGTRSGDLDPSILLYLMDRGYTSAELNDILNKKSGMLGVSEVSSDMRDLKEAARKGNHQAQETLDVYTYRIRKYIGSYAANLVKVDAIVFTGGIGENNADIREQICERLENIGIVIDKDKNNSIPNGGEGIISSDYSQAVILAIPTNEELQIAVDTYKLVYNAEIAAFQK
ncbi:MAG: acetate kinase [Spirochaetes bacterium]|nr:acetate kinase [Spirochaetota bacterium]